MKTSADNRRFVGAPGVILITLTALVALPAMPALATQPGDLPVTRTRYYRIHSELDPAFTQDIARRMDGMYAEYCRRLASFENDKPAAEMEVYLFKKQADYLRFLGQPLQNSGGVFMPGRNTLAAFVEVQGRDGLRRTLQHEAFHQFAYLMISHELPAWLNEGLAEVFGEAIWTGDGFLLGQVPPRRVRQMQHDIENRRLIHFDRLMSMPQSEWNAALAATEREAAEIEYNQSWAMVHFLVQAKDATGRERYRSRLIQMLKLLHDGKDGRKAFEQAFSANTRGFEERFVEYVRTLTATPEASMIARQHELANALVDCHSRGVRFTQVADFRQAFFRAERQGATGQEKTGETTGEPGAKLLFADPTGRLLDANELYFSSRTGAPLPDLVCHASDKLQLRTRFLQLSDRRLEYEVLVE
jgi:hypothetical protein